MLPLTALLLGLLAVALAWPVPAVLARAGWTRRDPVAALVCWQAVGLAGGLSIIGALLVHGLSPWGGSLPEAWWAWARHWFTGAQPAGPVRGDHWVAQTLAAVLALELLGVLVLALVRTARTRARHRALLELLVDDVSGVDARVLESPVPAAFCIPGARPLLVLSSGMVAELDPAELAAVVAHERAHLAERHHLLLMPFVAWREALPVLPAADRAHDAVRDLVEMRADDVALRAVPGPAGRRTLAKAIVAAAEGGAPQGALAAGGGVLTARVTRLLEPPAELPRWARPAAIGAAITLVAAPTLLLVLPAVV
ncbi:Peptidase family M48 [Klenkia soli]|uniref:Peptidase family M48 n=1 Tax=Klenkia soli TaxID=1052260 RepID=A0A1H0QFH5_9ACTN|nr:M56 family metallopeptidase [Klenkia soli]SDP16034.1 Peptidase family M48 [Klenkia soli]